MLESRLRQIQAAALIGVVVLVLNQLYCSVHLTNSVGFTNNHHGVEPIIITRFLNGTLTLSHQQYQYRYPRWYPSPPTSQTIIYMVISAAKNAHRRQMVRHTWGSQQQVYFVIGHRWRNTTTRNLEQSIEQEFQEFQDLIWLDMDETYANMPVKTYGGFHAIHRHHPSRRHAFILKTDDDVYIKPQLITTPLNTSVGVMGYCVGPEQVPRSEENSALSNQEYPDNKFPPYCYGAAHVVSPTFLRCALPKAAAMSFYLKAEDVWTGILAHRCNLTVQPVDDWLDLYAWTNTSVTLHFGYLFHGEAELAHAMHRMHAMNTINQKENRIVLHNVLETLGSTVDCGENRRAAACNLCPQGNDSSFCGGDCQYCPVGTVPPPTFQIYNDECRAKSNGVCPLVDCGEGVEADSCLHCPHNQAKNWCSGDCAIHKDTCHLQFVHCGGFQQQAANCSACSRGIGQWCDSGDCLLMDDTCVEMPRPAQNVTCGNHEAPVCAACPQGRGADWCHGDCRWCQGKCVDSESCQLKK